MPAGAAPLQVKMVHEITCFHSGHKKSIKRTIMQLDALNITVWSECLCIIFCPIPPSLVCQWFISKSFLSSWVSLWLLLFLKHCFFLLLFSLHFHCFWISGSSWWGSTSTLQMRNFIFNVFQFKTETTACSLFIGYTASKTQICLVGWQQGKMSFLNLYYFKCEFKP